ncbi:MAG: cyclase [Betaproteobacteria bacterium]|nr:cyclase [Betaproteobacteria bacterium]
MLHAPHMHPDSSRVVPGFLYGLAASLVFLVHSADAQDVLVNVVREGDFVVVSASADMPVERSIAWEVLTNYDRYAEFIPHLRVSRVVSRSGGGLVLEQQGEFRFLFFRQPLELRLAVTEKPQYLVESRSLSGSLKDLKGNYELHDAPGGLRLLYSGRFVPDISLPWFIGLFFVRAVIEKEFSALVAEILRRNSEHLRPIIR